MTSKLPPPLRLGLLYLGLAGMLLVMAGCGGNMRDDSRLKPYEPSAAFANSQSARPLEPDTVSRSESTDERFTTGKAAATELDSFPIEITHPVLEEGQQRFAIFCTPCHGAAGNGKGVASGYFNPRPASFYDPRLKAAPVGHFFDVMTNGYRGMYSYASRITPAQRWAITAYVRALQLNQQAPLDVPLEKIKASGAGVTP